MPWEVWAHRPPTMNEQKSHSALHISSYLSMAMTATRSKCVPMRHIYKSCSNVFLYRLTVVTICTNSIESKKVMLFAASLSRKIVKLSTCCPINHTMKPTWQYVLGWLWTRVLFVSEPTIKFQHSNPLPLLIIWMNICCFQHLGNFVVNACNKFIYMESSLFASSTFTHGYKPICSLFLTDNDHIRNTF